jgi:hypothetical protein
MSKKEVDTLQNKNNDNNNPLPDNKGRSIGNYILGIFLLIIGKTIG